MNLKEVIEFLKSFTLLVCHPRNDSLVDYREGDISCEISNT